MGRPADGAQDFSSHKTDHPVKTLLGKDVEIVADEGKGAFFVKPGDFEVLELSEVSSGFSRQESVLG